MNSPLPALEWDFSSVEDADLRDCCLYEYAREVVDQTESAPWLSLSEDEKAEARLQLAVLRRDVTRSPGRTSILGPLSPVRVTMLAPQTGEPLWIGSDDVFIPDSEGLSPGRILIAREINLAAYSDDQLLEEFETLLKSLRKEHKVPPPQARGKKASDDRAALANLAWMRIRHSFPREEIKKCVCHTEYEQLREVFAKKAEDGRIRSLAEVIDEIDKRRSRAKEFYTRLFFPGCSEPTPPKSWRTFAELGD